MTQILSSQWGSLNPNLLAHLYVAAHEAGPNGGTWGRDKSSSGDIEVAFPISNGDLEISLQWISPFEAIGAESKLPLVSGLLQSGAGNSALSALAAVVPEELQEVFKDQGQAVKDSLAALKGVTGITKLNSTQIFSGMQPMKFQITAHFRAWADPKSEVEDPVNQICEWALPQVLSKAGFLENLANTHSLIQALFPSKVPKILGFSYGGSTILPVVIESINEAIVSPRDETGARINVTLQISLATLAAIDRGEYAKYGFR